MKNARIYIGKKENYDVLSHSISSKIAHICAPAYLKLYLVYDIFNIEDEGLHTLAHTILSNAQTDIVYDKKPDTPACLAWEYLPGQYDQRGEAAEQCFALADYNYSPSIRSGYFLALSEDAIPRIDALKKYLVNPVDSREKDIDRLVQIGVSQVSPIPSAEGFIRYSIDDIRDFIKKHRFSIGEEDIVLIQDYFREEKRDPSFTELKIIDTYWSDHCRHTTFLTYIERLDIESVFKESIQSAWNDYLLLREKTHTEHKPVSLMDIATIAAKYFKKNNILTTLEESVEINACSVKVKINIGGKKEDWFLMFKNETHNHPTEIDPYGGASTCIGGAIRDPLSGRAYVYQAMRISGSGNPLERMQDVLPGKLPQKKITQEAAQGFSGYGNQIGIATSHVSEIYHDGYRAKRLEAGFVVGAAPEARVRRAEPAKGDRVIVVGGRTGKDGIGGASGSSQTVDRAQASEDLSAEVQKGNAPLERALQRLFRNSRFSSRVKKSNDFGAGGVSVAIGELARGVRIYLDDMPLKYSSLNELEIAISESQERMAVVCDPSDAETIMDIAKEENVEAAIVAEITDDDTLRMIRHGKEVVCLKRNFLDTNGAVRKINAVYVDGEGENPFARKEPFSPSIFLDKIKSLRHCSQEGLINQFDYSIGKGTVISPLGGTRQKTKEDAGVQLFPSPGTTTCSAISFGYMPDLAMWSPFHAGMYAVVESVAKLVAAGVELNRIYLSFQEYFERLESNAKKWGKPLGALLGALQAQYHLRIAAIGGKDSMSGSYRNIDVPPTLISFAIGTIEQSDCAPNTLPKDASWLYAAKPKWEKNSFIPEWRHLIETFRFITELHRKGIIQAAKAIGEGGIAISLADMAWGNRVGFSIADDALFAPYIGGILIATKEPIENKDYLTLLGKTDDSELFQFSEHSITISEAEALREQTLEPIFPNTYSTDESARAEDIALPYYNRLAHMRRNAQGGISPSVLIPVFPGTNCEYDTAYSFEKEGARTDIFIFNNSTKRDIERSIAELAARIDKNQILCLSGGFSYADEPDGAAKYIASILLHPSIERSLQRLLEREGLVLGICNGFQALIRSKLLPSLHAESPALLSHNLIGRHISTIANIKIVSSLSPWIAKEDVGKVYRVPISHGEGRFTMDKSAIKELAKQGQIVSQYVDAEGRPSMRFPHNPNGSDFAIEGIADKTGRVYGRMSHPERYDEGLFKNIPSMEYHNIFKNGIAYFA